eukprot:scaffold7729_cov88-Skeletonema_dohrnii-CCMP3373.AAC.3
MPRYKQELFDAKESLDRDLRELLAWYAEDVMRAVERKSDISKKKSERNIQLRNILSLSQ